MAVVYFTSNASTGAGSLAEAIQNAEPGDVIRPDETVFERGSALEIVLAGTLSVSKNLTLDGGPFRVALNGGGSVACASVANGATVEFTAFDFIGGATAQNGGGLNVETGANVALNRCRVCGCDAAENGGGVCVDDGATLELDDSVIIGCRANVGGGVYLGATARFTSNGSTLALNVDAASNNGSGGFSDVVAASGFDATSQPPIGSIICAATSDGSTLYDATTAAENGSVVGVSSAEVGFVAPGGVSAPYESWSRDAWQDRDLRLLDDATPNPSPYRDSGDVGAMSQYDLQGNFRGRETNGATTCSPGAYETIQADLFWIGRDATGAEVVSPSFLTSDGWAASRFATASGDAAPQAGQTVFVDGDVSFVEFLSKSVRFIVGGGAVFASSDGQISFTAAKLQVGLGATFKSKFTLSQSSRVGAWARLTTFGAAAATVEFGVASRADYFRVSAGELSIVPLYGRLELRPASALSIKIAGRYNCSSLTVIHQAGVADLRIKAESATFRAKTVSFTRSSEEPSDLFDAPVVVELHDAAKVTVPDGAPESWADAFEVDLSETTDATLTLSGQTVYGDAPAAAVSLTGSAKVDARGLDVASLTLNADATLTAQNATVNAETLNLAAGSILTVDGGSVDAESLTSTAGSTLTIVGATVNVAALTLADGAVVGFSGDDATLAATNSATVGAATFSGTGYFATPPGTSLSAATIPETVRACDYGADVSSFNALSETSTSALLSWVKQNPTPSVLIEEANESGWNVVNNRATGDSLSVDISAPKTFRLFDGESFFTASARPYGTAYELAEEQTIGYLKTLISTGYLN